MANLLSDMQNKNDYFYNKYSKDVNELEQSLNDRFNLNVSSDFSDTDNLNNNSFSTSSNNE